jgi:anti-sigma regulatory factor (Ser/Thr protein kinase)
MLRSDATKGTAERVSDVIRLTIPAVLAYVRLPRVAIAGLATRSGFSYDEVEDLRLAVGEVCQVLLDGANRDGTLTIAFTVERGRVGVEVTSDGPAGRHDGAGERLAGQILQATVGSIEISEEGRRISFDKTASDADY